MNNEFKKTRWQLTKWYLVILMVLAFIFSIVVFVSLNAELLRSARREQQKIISTQLNYVMPKPLPDPQDLPKELINPPLGIEIKQSYISARNTLILQIVLINTMLLALGTYAAYILSGKTLSPIEQMLIEQRQFISNASHELRTPIATIKTAIEVTLKMGQIPYAQIKKILMSNLEDINNMELLINNLLSFEKYSEHRDYSNQTSIVINTLLSDCVQKIKTASNRNIKFQDNHKKISVLGDHTSLVEMINIFLDNAIKYSSPNGKISVNLICKEGQAEIKISDNGMGISDQDLPHIFDRFYRANHSRSKDSIPGYGLGLSIAREIVNNHNGKVIVSSKLSNGTTFTIFLPIV
ncbi:MAG: HAMP domain-containing sensor histidine kinase [bacterium]